MNALIRRTVGHLAVICILLVFTSTSQARRFHRKHLHAPKTAYTAIASVNTSAMTITTIPKNSTATGTKTYRISSQTAVTVNGHPGTLADLKPGLRIRVGAGADPDVAEELSASAPPANPR